MSASGTLQTQSQARCEQKTNADILSYACPIRLRPLTTICRFAPQAISP